MTKLIKSGCKKQTAGRSLVLMRKNIGLKVQFDHNLKKIWYKYKSTTFSFLKYDTILDDIYIHATMGQ